MRKKRVKTSLSSRVFLRLLFTFLSLDGVSAGNSKNANVTGRMVNGRRVSPTQHTTTAELPIKRTQRNSLRMRRFAVYDVAEAGEDERAKARIAN
jgi:hypothetical protein